MPAPLDYAQAARPGVGVGLAGALSGATRAGHALDEPDRPVAANGSAGCNGLVAATNGVHHVVAAEADRPQSAAEILFAHRATRRMAGEFICGAAAGVGWVAVGQPLDTVKVRIQANPRPAPGGGGALRVAASLFREGGAASFYRGAGPEFALSLLCGTLKFPLYLRLREEAVPGAWGVDDAARTRRAHFRPGELCRVGAAGALAGFIMAPVMTPLETVKCRLQVLHARGFGRPTAREAVAGGGLFNGLGVTTLRSTAGNAVYFGTVETVRARLEAAGAGPLTARVFAGGCAGAAFWALLYPVDCVKTRMQTSPPSAPAAQSAAAACVELVSEGGWRRFTRGMGIAALRGFPASAAGFVAFDSCHHHMLSRGYIDT
eukprot:TRINITY_DN65377_c0_g1_i1.p1 TRINITY_DN65377_c0_g1~~TRINITY_DN65377_c0_g1_i1.p1  ORF type:complete len:402 (+),score=95.44 TRINITY_DN65377_c0_g1_i1:80-1207(+)